MRLESSLDSFDSLDLDESIPLIFLEITGEDQQLINLMNEKLSEICTGGTTTDLHITKLRIKQYLSGKDYDKIIGAVSEFFIGLLLVDIGFRQEYIFLNLEENGAKKGFDGCFTKDGAHWLMESKSGKTLTQGNSFKSKLKEAYSDLSGKVKGESVNNPWQNALHHSMIRNFDSVDMVYSELKSFSEDYIQGKFYEIDKFKVIPAATLYIEEDTVVHNINDIKNEVNELVSKFKYDDLVIFCISNKTCSIFLNYLNM